MRCDSNTKRMTKHSYDGHMLYPHPNITCWDYLVDVVYGEENLHLSALDERHPTVHYLAFHPWWRHQYGPWMAFLCCIFWPHRQETWHAFMLGYVSNAAYRHTFTKNFSDVEKYFGYGPVREV